MMKEKDTEIQKIIKVNITGGILSPGDLRKIIRTAKNASCLNIHLGERQNLYIHIDTLKANGVVKELKESNFNFEVDANNYPNIVSSYVSEGIFTNYNNWVSEGVYRDILDSFNYRPKYKINIVDNSQGLIPLFTGNFNFISSESSNFWYLYLRRKADYKLECWPELIYSTEISILSQTLESLLSENNNLTIHQLQQKIKETKHLITLEKEAELILPKVRFPYYEGMNKNGDSNWLGIYRRNNDFNVNFLEDVCNLCAQTKLGLIQLTSWKTLLIKGIEERDRIKWEKLLGKYSINIRHSSIELNWQIKDGDKSALKLKQYLVKKLDYEDVRTFGLSFAIKSDYMNVSTSVIIEKKLMPEAEGKKIYYYNLSYAEGFNPNKQNYTLYLEGIKKSELKDKIIDLCKYYYSQFNNDPITDHHLVWEEKDNSTYKKVHQCSHCLSIYDKEYGDVFSGIEVGTIFENLPPDYKCPTCDNSKADFIEVELQTVAK